MRIKKLRIDNYKNLRNLSIDFNEKSFTSVIVGQNGTGKSNILEALILIFRDLDLGGHPSFKYQIEYKCRGNIVNIDANPEKERNTFSIKINDNKISYKKFNDLKKELYLPNYVFGYYSGPSNRMEKLFEPHQNKFYTELINKNLINKPEKPLRPLLYARHIHSQFALLAFFYEKDETIKKFLNDYLSIEGFDSVLFVIKEPPWDSNDGDPRFWNDRGSVQQLLSKLYERSIAPLRIKQEVHVDFRKRSNLEHLYLYLKDLDALEKLSSQYVSPQEFFKALESTYISKLISEVRIRVKVRKKDGSLTFSELSEGEQQLLMVLGLLRFTNEAESLFLLDEPDTHLNPAWSVRYLEILKDVVGEQETSNIIMTTHDPLVISSLKKSQVIILRLDEKKNQFVAEHPENDPVKMGYPEIITSELFNLRSIVSPPILRLLDKKRILASKESLTNAERKKLDSLNQQIGEFDFTSVVRDPLYEPFVRAMSVIEKEQNLQEVVLTKEQQEYRKKLAIEILRKVKNDMDKEI